MRDWDAHFMKHAHLAAEMSTCCRRNVGAVIVRNRRLIATGFNGNVPGAGHCDLGGCRICENNAKAFAPAATNIQQCVCVHAEVNAVAFAARMGVSVLDGVMYSTHQPCLDCTKLIAVAGIETVYFDEEYPSPPFEHPTLQVVHLA